MRPDWNSYFMMMAKLAALRSTCNSRPTGAVLVKDKRIIATGYNGSLPGKSQCSDEGENYCYRRTVKGKEDDKYNICPSIHAEANAIAQAAMFNISTIDTTMYCTLSPCLVCAKLLLAAGVTKLYYELPYESEDLERDQEWMCFNERELLAERFIMRRNLRDSVAHNIIIFTSMRRLLGKK